MRKVLVVFTVVAASMIGFGGRSASAASIFGGTNLGEHMLGTATRDIMFGKGGDDRIIGAGGNDLIFGGGGADKLIGAAGNDTLVDDDGTGGDVLLGGSGFDTLYSLDGGRDKLDCGPNGGVAFADPHDIVHRCTHVIRRTRTFRGFNVRVAGNGNSTVRGGRDPSIIFGRNGNDVLRGGRDDDMLFGGGGNDILQGFRGDDTFIDDDSTPNETIETGGDDGDIVYAADGASGIIDCVNRRGRSSDALVFADGSDSTLHCSHVIRI